MAALPGDLIGGTELHWLKRPLPLKTQVFRFIPVLLISTFILAAALLVTNARMPDPKLVRPLPDIGFELFAKIEWLETVTDVCIAILNVISVLLVLKLYLLHRQNEGEAELVMPFNIPFVSRFLFGVWDGGYICDIGKRDVHLIACIRFLASYSVMLLFRSLVITMTSYPATDNKCQEPVEITDPLKNIFLTVVTLGSGSIHCGDLMFSGHTIIITLNLMLHWTYGPLLHWFFRPVSIVLVTFSFYCIIASRSHYTDDILVAFYSTAATFLVMRHSPDGAPWQLQLIIRWWPCCGPNSQPTEQGAQVTIVVCDEAPHRRETATEGEENGKITAVTVDRSDGKENGIDSLREALANSPRDRWGM
ncbi:putative phosphatidylcholine:ceramide cholinephosphotransferase 2 [Trypanosoma grayi]|uniref:putative phosphatidylcholine:ceramide cholinephosphotransferase 2 n=1 Tax=Trypanosoma grayi TaxID=71804 RepID=UPI0004F4A228|nr:putative phosphatidylcholine:ceramide cholinephosphotransferase 2 [Trypanosoma grayi]KEG08891.1 putative phosphatidylcholine:ceramide cholinephosphotransferase 2 [Trypanosoma grayi]